MAKTTPVKLSKAAAALQAVLPKDVMVIDVPLDSQVEVDVDVNAMTIPYTIALDTAVVIKSLVDRREPLPDMPVGTHRLSWGFSQTEKDWKQKVTLIVSGKKTVLDEKSEANKDKDHTIGLAFLVVS